MKTDNISFGTKPSIGYISAQNGLPKYSDRLAQGIYNAFSELSSNGINDQFIINIKPKPKAKNPLTDHIELLYFNPQNTYQSSITLSPRNLAKLQINEISRKLVDSYKLLKQSTQKCLLGVGYPETANTLESKKLIAKLSTKDTDSASILSQFLEKVKGTPQKHQEKLLSVNSLKKIEILMEKFGFDDWTCA